MGRPRLFRYTSDLEQIEPNLQGFRLPMRRTLIRTSERHKYSIAYASIATDMPTLIASHSDSSAESSSGRNSFHVSAQATQHLEGNSYGRSSHNAMYVTRHLLISICLETRRLNGSLVLTLIQCGAFENRSVSSLSCDHNRILPWGNTSVQLSRFLIFVYLLLLRCSIVLLESCPILHYHFQIRYYVTWIKKGHSVTLCQCSFYLATILRASHMCGVKIGF